MTLYFQEKSVKLLLGDTLELLKQIPRQSIDLIFADPPYHLSSGGFSCHAGERTSVDKGSWDQDEGIEKNFKFHTRWMRACRRILKPNGSLWVSGTYHSIYSCGFILQKQGWHIINDISWLKPNATPNLSCRMFTASHETLIWARKDKKAKHTFNYSEIKNGHFAKDFIKKPHKQMRSVWMIGTPGRAEKKYGKHPTQKPESLLERIIIASTNENDCILDPFCGSGTTGVMAVKHKRQFVGLEREQAYYDDMAIPRIKELLST